MKTRPQLFWQLILIFAFFAGCGARYAAVGHIDLSSKGAKCEKILSYPGARGAPGLELTLSDANGSTRKYGSHPDWLLVIQVDVIDAQSSKVVVSTKVTKERMQFAGWHLPATCLSLPMLERRSVLQERHSYQFCAHVLEPVKA